MSELLSGALGAIAAILGGWLAQRYAAREAHQARVETRRGEQRRVLSELLIAGRAKVDMYQLLIPVMGRMSDRDLEEFTATDTGQKMGRVNDEVQRAIVQARLLIGDHVLAETLATIRRLNDSFSEEVMGAVLKRRAPGGTDEDLRPAFRHLGKMEDALNTIETQAMDLLQITVG